MRNVGQVFGTVLFVRFDSTPAASTYFFFREKEKVSKKKAYLRERTERWKYRKVMRSRSEGCRDEVPAFREKEKVSKKKACLRERTERWKYRKVMRSRSEGCRDEVPAFREKEKVSKKKAFLRLRRLLSFRKKKVGKENLYCAFGA